MSQEPENILPDDHSKSEIRIANRQLLEDRAANNGTVIIIKDGKSQLVSARKLLDELIEQEKRNK